MDQGPDFLQLKLQTTTSSGMTEKILAVLFLFIKSVVAATGYSGIALLMAIESACIPLPSELIMPFAGYLVYEGAMKLVWVATAGAIGCNLGSLVAYEIGCYGGRPLVEKYGRWILMGRRELDWADRFFLRWGYLAVLIARLLPVIRTFIALARGSCPHASRALPPLHFPGILALVLRSGLAGHEAGRELARAGQVLSPIRSGDRNRACGRGDMVRAVALAEQNSNCRLGQSTINHLKILSPGRSSMKLLLLFLLSAMLMNAVSVAQAPPAGSDKPFVIEYYYKTKWGHADEFLRLFKKNHYPLLKKEVEMGRMLKVWMDQPRYHTTEDGRWDYRVTIVFKNAAVANEPFDEDALKKQLFPDQQAYEREEQRRFEILDAHWDLPVKVMDLDK